MKRLLQSIALMLLTVFLSADYAYAKACFLPNGSCPDELYEHTNEFGENCPYGYRLGVVTCAKNFTLETTQNSDGEICGRCVCNLSCKDGEAVNNDTCTCDELFCPLGTVSTCSDDACYDCEHVTDLKDGTPCYKNTRREAECPLGYVLRKPSASCVLEKRQICGSETCYKEMICPPGLVFDDHCNCVPGDANNCPTGYSKNKPEVCYDEITHNGLKCYKDKVCETGYRLNENCECVPYCEEPYKLEQTNKCDDKITFGDHFCYKEKICDKANYSLNLDTCECECDEDLIADTNGEELCVDCDENGVNPCTEKNYKLCKKEDFLIGEGPVVCTCGDKEYYERCSTIEQCYVDQDAAYGTIDGCHQETSVNNTSKYYDYINSVYVNKGRYFVKNKCQKVDLSWVIHTAECDVEKDCNGNVGPAFGKIKQGDCVGGAGNGRVTCGGADYFASCQCPYKKTDNIKANGGSCSYMDEKSLPLTGYYKVDGYDCSANGETYVAVASCMVKKDCNGNAGIAYNKIRMNQCIGNIGNNPLECGSETYVASCKCPYKKSDSITENGGLCLYYEQNTDMLQNGFYKVDGYACTAGNETGTAIASCTISRDCKGNKGPAYGMKNCKANGLYPADDHPIVCGGIVYSKLCKDSCNYDDTEATCRSKGKGFISYCVAHTDTGDVAHGECVD